MAAVVFELASAAGTVVGRAVYLILLLVNLDDLRLLLLDGSIRGGVEALLHVIAEMARIIRVHSVVRLGTATLAGICEVLLWMVPGLGL
jgi:hypothetical protein